MQVAASRTAKVVLLVCGLALSARGQERVEAYSSEGFGVARVTLDVPPGASSSPAGDDRFTITGPPGQVLYPVQQAGQVRKLLGSLLGIEGQRRSTYYFLFVGQAPLELTSFTPDAAPLRIVPKADPRRHRQLFEEWWREYSRFYERVHREAEYPVNVQTYLTALWSQRLNVEMPQLEGFFLREHEKGGTWLGKTLGDEAYRASLLRDLTLGRLAGNEVADQPLPPSPAALPIESPGNVEVEPLATVVPAECFYIRFGSYKNYSSTSDFLKRWQGDLGNLVVLRSIHRDTGALVQQQLGLVESSLSKVFGPSVISDVAFIGLDPYLRDGAAFGILFQAQNNFLLNNSISGQRRTAAKALANATQETVTIAGQEVSYTSTPGGELRSYYATRGEFHLVCTSRALVERFLQAGQERPSLAQSRDFLQAREMLPPQQDGVVFAHVSRAFWDNLTSPAMRLEFDRRLQSLAEIEALTLARYAAAQEQVPATTPAELSEAGYLPPDFGRHADGSQLVALDDGGWADSLRGRPGRMTPIADLPSTSATGTELQRIASYQQTIEAEAGQLPPLSFELRREELGSDAPTLVTIRARVGDYSQSRIAGLAKRLGAPTTRRVAPLAGDVVALEAVIDDPLRQRGPVHVFAGLRNSPIPLDIRGGGLSLATALPDAIRFYVGLSPRLGLFDALIGPPREPWDADGLARTGGLFQVWTHQAADLFLFAFGRDVLLEVVPQFQFSDDEVAAQARLSIGEIVGTQLEYAANAFGYARARQTSASGSRYMNALHRQLGVPNDQCQTVAEQLIGGTFVCPLGGRYLLVEIPGGVQAWASTAAAPNNQFVLTEVPADFQLPLLTWFHGLQGRLTQAPDDALVLDLTLANQLPPEGEGQADPSDDPPVAPDPRSEELPVPPPQ